MKQLRRVELFSNRSYAAAVCPVISIRFWHSGYFCTCNAVAWLFRLPSCVNCEHETVILTCLSAHLAVFCDTQPSVRARRNVGMVHYYHCSVHIVWYPGRGVERCGIGKSIWE